LRILSTRPIESSKIQKFKIVSINGCLWIHLFRRKQIPKKNSPKTKSRADRWRSEGIFSTPLPLKAARENLPGSSTVTGQRVAACAGAIL
jgi:hypothetical protein